MNRVHALPRSRALRNLDGMRSIILALPLLLSACVDGTRDGSTADSVETADATDARDASEVDTGGVTCGKCVRLWHTEERVRNGRTWTCLVEDATGVVCCEDAGDTGCLPLQSHFEWAECSEVIEVFGVVGCADDDAYVRGGVVSPTGARCQQEVAGCANGRPESL